MKFECRPMDSSSFFLSQIPNTYLSKVFSATPWCRALVTTAPSPPPCFLYPWTGSLRKERQQVLIWLSKCFHFKVTDFQIITPTMASQRDIKKSFSSFRIIKTEPPFTHYPKHPETLHKVFQTFPQDEHKAAYNTSSFNRDKHNAKRFCSFMHQFSNWKHPFLRVVRTIHQVLTCFSVCHKWNWKLLPRLTKCIWIRDRMCDTPGTHTYTQHTAVRRRAW